MQWLYETNEDNSARFVLGQIFNPSGKTLLCFGINPSTACPTCLDNTIKKIINIANFNGYENWIMLNIYPQRATNPNDLHLIKDGKLVDNNLLHIENIAKLYKNYDVLLAYGNLISKRSFLKHCLDEIICRVSPNNYKQIKVIKFTKLGNPVHPLYQPKNSTLINYISN